MVFTWALRRQLFYIAILIAFFGIFGYLIVSPYVNKIPSCFDGKQNGNETGVDCGGSCAKACLYQVDQVSILWARAFQVVPGRYNAVAYLENHNSSNAIEKINYEFRFADKNNLYIGKRDGETLVPPSGKFAVFEPALNFGNSIPVYTTFKFTETPLWVQVPANLLNNITTSVSDIQLSGEKTSPRLSATVTNNSLFIIPNINVVAILYDKDGNAVSASSTYLEQLTGGESAQVNFTWPELFTGTVVAENIIPMYDIFQAKLK